MKAYRRKRKARGTWEIEKSRLTMKGKEAQRQSESINPTRLRSRRRNSLLSRTVGSLSDSSSDDSELREES